MNVPDSQGHRLAIRCVSCGKVVRYLDGNVKVIPGVAAWCSECSSTEDQDPDRLASE